MAMSLHETLSSALRPSLVGAAGAVLDEPDIGVKRGLEASFAAILGGLMKGAGDGKLMSELSEIVTHRDNDLAAPLDPMTLLRGGPNSNAMMLGNRLLASLFGDRQGGIVRAIARSAGISVPSASSLFTMAAPIVIGQLGRRTSTQGSTPGSLTGLFNAEREPITAYVPPYMRPLVGLSQPGNHGLLDGSIEGGLRSLLLLAVPLLCVLGIFWYVLPPIQGNMEVKIPEKPPVLEGKVEYRDEWRRDTPATAPATRPSDGWPDEPADGRERPKDNTATPGGTATAEVTPAPAVTPAKAPPIAGLVRMTLPDGVDIDVVPYGLEQKVVAFADDRYAVIDKTRWFDFDRLRFLSGSTELTPGSRAQLRNVAKIMKAYPDMQIKIGGYTDNLGSPESNMRLSDGRAKSAMNQLVKLGVAANRLEAEGYGEQHPIADNATAEGRARNRRTALSVRAK